MIIVLSIHSGNCSFEQKVRNAQAAGYAAVIVHNVGSEDLGNFELMTDSNL